MTHYAHSGRLEDRGEWRLLADHLEATADLAASPGSALGLGNAARLAGLFHDFDKHDPEFDRVLRREDVRVDHWTAGCSLLLQRVPPTLRPVAEVLAYAILGHHAGLPNRRGSEGSLDRRCDGFRDPIDPEITDAADPDFKPCAQELASLMRPGKCGFDLSVATRMIFSCLVDADFRDTEAFYGKLDNRTPRS